MHQSGQPETPAVEFSAAQLCPLQLVPLPVLAEMVIEGGRGRLGFSHPSFQDTGRMRLTLGMWDVPGPKVQEGQGIVPLRNSPRRCPLVQPFVLSNCTQLFADDGSGPAAPQGPEKRTP